MALPWVKLHVSLIDNDVFKRLSKAAKLTFYTALALAGKQDLDGILAIRTGPMTVEEIAYYTSLTKGQKAALDELIAAGFLSQTLDGAYVVERWAEKAGDASRDRTRRYRDRHRDVTETSPRQKSDAADKEEEKEIDMDALRSSALAFGEWPPRVDGLKSLALLFLAAFGNCRDEAKSGKHLPHYAQLLAQMRSRNVPIAVAWQACVDARAAANDKPLFGASIKTAMSYLPSGASKPAPRATRELRDEDLV